MNMIALYVRVSTQEQAKEGYSIGEQETRLKAYCNSRGWSDYQLFTDAGFSGGNMNRPALKEMLYGINKGTVKTVIVYKLDRLSRSQKDTIEMLEDVFLPNDINFISITENFDTSSPFGKAMIGMFSVFAQLEREQIKERITTGREARSKEGKWHGGGFQPVGYDYKDGFLKVNEYEAAQIREVFDLYLQGYAPTEIVTTMNAKGYTHKYGSWSISRVKGTLTNNIYIGVIKFRGIETPGLHEPIVDRETFEKASNKLLNNRTTKPYKRRPINEAYLTGKLICGHCGKKYTHVTSLSGHNPKNPLIHYYTCTARIHYKQLGVDKCNGKRHRCDQFDAMIIDEIKKLKFEEIKKRQKPDISAAVKREIAKLEKQKSRLIDLYALGSFDAAELTAKIDPVTAKIRKLQTQITIKTDTVDNAIKSIKDVFEAGDPVKIRHLIDALIDRIEIKDDDITIFWNFN